MTVGVPAGGEGEQGQRVARPLTTCPARAPTSLKDTLLAQRPGLRPTLSSGSSQFWARLPPCTHPLGWQPTSCHCCRQKPSHCVPHRAGGRQASERELSTRKTGQPGAPGQPEALGKGHPGKGPTQLKSSPNEPSRMWPELWLRALPGAATTPRKPPRHQTRGVSVGSLWT